MFTDKEFIANKIKTFRKYAGLTQAELAEQIGISDKHVCRIENGAYMPSLETFLKIAQVLNINLDEFGLDVKATKNVKREKFIKFLYSISDSEIEFYYNIIAEIHKGLPSLKR